jgi:hypothetical protein
VIRSNTTNAHAGHTNYATAVVMCSPWLEVTISSWCGLGFTDCRSCCVAVRLCLRVDRRHRPLRLPCVGVAPELAAGVLLRVVQRPAGRAGRRRLLLPEAGPLTHGDGIQARQLLAPLAHRIPHRLSSLCVCECTMHRPLAPPPDQRDTHTQRERERERERERGRGGGRERERPTDRQTGRQAARDSHSPGLHG